MPLQSPRRTPGLTVRIIPVDHTVGGDSLTWRSILIAIMVAGVLVTHTVVFAGVQELCEAEAQSLMGRGPTTSSPDVTAGSVSARGNPGVSNAQGDNDVLVYQAAYYQCLRRYAGDRPQQPDEGTRPTR